jgi:hypothetical protein
MQPMSGDSVIARLRELLAKATPGPWLEKSNMKRPSHQRIVANDDGLTLVADTYGDPDLPPYDLLLIVEAVNALPALLRLIDAAEALDAAMGEADLAEEQLRQLNERGQANVPVREGNEWVARDVVALQAISDAETAIQAALHALTESGR